LWITLVVLACSGCGNQDGPPAQTQAGEKGAGPESDKNSAAEFTVEGKLRVVMIDGGAGKGSYSPVQIETDDAIYQLFYSSGETQFRNIRVDAGQPLLRIGKQHRAAGKLVSPDNYLTTGEKQNRFLQATLIEDISPADGK
jgi:hypothetical protein